MGIQKLLKQSQLSAKILSDKIYLKIKKFNQKQ